MKRARDRVLLLGGLGLVLALGTVVVFFVLDRNGSPHPDFGLSQVEALEEGPIDRFDLMEVEGSAQTQTSDSGMDEREALGALAIPTVNFMGRAEDRISREGLEGAAIKVRVGEDVVVGVTGAGGAFSVAIPEDARLDVEASADGYIPARRAGVRPDTEAVFRLYRSTSLSGLVVGPAGKDLEEAEVHVLADDRRETRALELELDERGAFKFLDLEPGEFNVAAWAPGWSYAVQRDVIVRPGEQTHLVFELDRAGSVSGQVIYEGTKTGIEGVEVQVDPDIQGLSREIEEIVTRSYRTDASGRVDLGSLNPGENRVRLYAPWGAMADAKRILVESGEHQLLTWTMTVPASCTGVLLDASGDPTVGTVTVTPVPQRYSEGNVSGEWKTRAEWPRTCTVGADGHFRFDALPSSMNLRFHGHSGMLLAGGVIERTLDEFVTLDRTLPPGGEVTDLELRMGRLATIEGIVLGPDEQPIADTAITTWRMRNATDLPTYTDEEGRFSLACILDRRGGLTIQHDAYQTHYERVGSEISNEPIVIHLKLANETVGRVVNENGEAVPWASVNARNGRDRRRNESTHADEFGRFRFYSLREGTWDVYPWASGYERTETLKIEVPLKGELTLHMQHVHVPDPATIRGRASLPDGTAPSRLRAESLRSAAMTVAGGEFRIDGLSPGDHNLVLEADGCAPSSLGKVFLREGETSDVGLIQMYPGIDVEVYLQDAKKQRVREARVRMEPQAGYAMDVGGTRKPRRERRGTYSMGKLELGTWALEVRTWSHKTLRQEVVLSEGRQRKIVLTLEPRD
jgi:hypothetical protein